MKKVRWGIVSTAKIAVKQVIPAMQQSKYCAIQAIASRTLSQAAAVAKTFNIPQAYGTYEELLQDPDIDAVYIPLPNHLHVPWSSKALAAGKHVLCEKPLALTTAEAQSLLTTAQRYPKQKIMEAFMYRHHPQWQRARQLISDGKIGTLLTIQSFFSYYNVDPKNVRNISAWGGGGLMDIGCYCISLSRFLFAREPQRVNGMLAYDPTFKVDCLAEGMLDFGDGSSTFTCATQLIPYQRVNIFGSQGRIEIEIPFNAPSDQPCKIIYQHQDQTEEISLDVCNQYTIQGDLFSQAIIEDTQVPTPLEDAVANMKVLEGLVASAKEGKWISV